MLLACSLRNSSPNKYASATPLTWFRAESGKTCVQLKYGTSVLDFSRGKNSVEVANDAELVSVLETLKKAVESGELDAQMATASEAVRKRFKR